MSVPLNHPMIIDPEPTVKERAAELLDDLYIGREPKDGASGEARAQAEADRELIDAALGEIGAAKTDEDADRIAMITVAKLLATGCRRGEPGFAGSGRRHQVAAGARIVSDKRPLPVFDAAAQSLGMQGSPVPVRAAQQLTQVGGAL